MELFKAVKKVTLTEQIMEQIATLITQGTLQPGDKLPNERELAETLGVTRSRVREALRALSLVGLITIKAGEGSFVTEREMPLPGETIAWMFHNEIHNLEEVYAARKLIETEVYLTAAAAMDAEKLAVLARLLGNCKQASNLGDPRQFLDHLDRFDLLMGEYCGNQIYSKLMQTIVHLRRETSLKLLHVPGAMESSTEIRSQLLQAMRGGDRVQIKRSISQFFKQSRRFYEKIMSN